MAKGRAECWRGLRTVEERTRVYAHARIKGTFRTCAEGLLFSIFEASDRKVFFLPIAVASFYISYHSAPSHYAWLGVPDVASGLL
jgi:hypothetical protein